MVESSQVESVATILPTYQYAQSAVALGAMVSVIVVVGWTVTVLVMTVTCVHPPTNEHRASWPFT